MKAFITILLFICAAGADRNWVRLPEAADLNELGNLLRGKNWFFFGLFLYKFITITGVDVLILCNR